MKLSNKTVTNMFVGSQGVSKCILNGQTIYQRQIYERKLVLADWLQANGSPVIDEDGVYTPPAEYDAYKSSSSGHYYYIPLATTPDVIPQGSSIHFSVLLNEDATIIDHLIGARYLHTGNTPCQYWSWEEGLRVPGSNGYGKFQFPEGYIDAIRRNKELEVIVDLNQSNPYIELMQDGVSLAKDEHTVEDTSGYTEYKYVPSAVKADTYIGCGAESSATNNILPFRGKINFVKSYIQQPDGTKLYFAEIIQEPVKPKPYAVFSSDISQSNIDSAQQQIIGQIGQELSAVITLISDTVIDNVKTLTFKFNGEAYSNSLKPNGASLYAINIDNIEGGTRLQLTFDSPVDLNSLAAITDPSTVLSRIEAFKNNKDVYTSIDVKFTEMNVAFIEPVTTKWLVQDVTNGIILDSDYVDAGGSFTYNYHNLADGYRIQELPQSSPDSLTLQILSNGFPIDEIPLNKGASHTMVFEDGADYKIAYVHNYYIRTEEISK